MRRPPSARGRHEDRRCVLVALTRPVTYLQPLDAPAAGQQPPVRDVNTQLEPPWRNLGAPGRTGPAARVGRPGRHVGSFVHYPGMDDAGLVLSQLTELLNSYAASALPAPADAHLAAWHDAAVRLLLDRRADGLSLLALAASGGGPLLEAVDRFPPATAAGTEAVLAGWRDAALPRSGRPATRPPGGWGSGPWNGELPGAWLPGLAVFHAAAAARLGLRASRLRKWAACGLIDWQNAPDPPDVPDPTNDADWQVDRLGNRIPVYGTDPRDDPNYRALERWVHGVGVHDAPLWFQAGYDCDQAAELAALPDGHPSRPSRDELAARALARAPHEASPS